MLRLSTCIIFLLLFLAPEASAVVCVGEQDGSPDHNENCVWAIKYPAGAVTINSDATATVTPATVPGGSDTYVQYNDGGSFGGEADFTYNETTGVLSITDGTNGYVRTAFGGSVNPTLRFDNMTGNTIGSLSAFGGSFYIDAGGGGSANGDVNFRPLGTGSSYFFSGHANAIPTVIKGAASQAGDLTQWQNSSGTALLQITSAGDIIRQDGTNMSFKSAGSIDFYTGNVHDFRMAHAGGFLPMTDNTMPLGGSSNRWTTVYTYAVDVASSIQGASFQIDTNSTGVLLDTDGDGMFIIAGTGNGNDEDLRINLDDTSNEIDVTSSTGVTNIEFNSIDLTVPTEAYDATNWNGDNTVPTKDAVRDQIEGISAGSTAWNSIGDASADGSIDFVATEQDIVGQLDSAGKSMFTLTNQDADRANATTILSLHDYDIDDAQGIFLDMVADQDGTPTSIYKFAQDGATYTKDLTVPTEAYDATGWNGDNTVPTKDAVRDKIETLGAGGGPSYWQLQLLPESAVLDDNSSPAITTIESSGTGTPRFRVADFDASTDEIIYWTFVVQSDMAAGDWLADVSWYTNDTTSGETAYWEAALSCTTEGDADTMAEQANGTTNSANEDINTTEANRLIQTTITMSNLDSVAAGDVCTLRFNRDADNGSDDLTSDARLVAVRLRIPRA